MFLLQCKVKKTRGLFPLCNILTEKFSRKKGAKMLIMTAFGWD